MPTITYQDNTYECSNDEYLLHQLNRQGAKLTSGCLGGHCHVCMLKVTQGEAPDQPQTDLKSELKEKGYFLPCICKPTSDFEISQPDRRDHFITVNVMGLDMLNSNVIRLRTNLPTAFIYKPGQFVHLIRPGDELTRSYSLASIGSDQQLEFHIRLLTDGKMSSWIANELQCGDEILISEAKGKCYYNKAYSERPLLLAGTGAGLAPLYGILRDALTSTHQARVYLLHGAKSAADLYYTDQLHQLAEQYENFIYLPIILNEASLEGALSASMDEHIADHLATDSNWISYLCGNSEIVGVMRRCCFKHGIEPTDIHCDAFI